MSEEPTPPLAPAPEPEPLPVARVRRRWPRLIHLAWLIPLVAAIVAGALIWERTHEYGPTIKIRFDDGTGLKPGQSEIRHLGVTVADVSAVQLSPDRDHVVVSARVRREAAAIAREGAVFWIVRPEVGIETVRGLATVITGPYIEVFPGSGPARTDFTGLDHPAPGLGRPGLHVTLATAQLSSIRPRTAVYYRGIQVGMVTGTSLNRDATAARVHLLIEPRYAHLVRIGSRFWTTSGVDVSLSLFKGVQISVDSLRSLVAGGIAFATPDAADARPRENTVFVLHDAPRKEWLDWAPSIALPAGDRSDE